MTHPLHITTIEELLNGGLTIQEACERLGIHRSTLWRHCRRFQEKGAEGLNHGLKGKRSNRAKPDEFRQQVCELYEREYRPQGHSVYYFYDRVARTLPDYVSYSTVLGWLRQSAPQTEQGELK